MPGQQRLATILRVVLVILQCSGALVQGRRPPREEDGGDHLKLLGKMMDAVDLALDFFSRDYSSINVDGLYGLRLGQGQLIRAIEECESSASCSDGIQRRLRKLNEELEITAKSAMSYVEESDPEYFQRFLPTVDSPYLLKFQAYRFSEADEYPIGKDSRYNEDFGDVCFGRMMGTFMENKKPVDRCNTTKTCLTFNMEKNGSEYRVTHQLLYFIMAEKEGCVEMVERETKVPLADTEKGLCGSILAEAKSSVKDGNVFEVYQDLFLEQVLLCGVIGFEDFLSEEWMRMILKWQTPVGCFTVKNPDLLEVERKLAGVQSEERQLMKDLKWEAAMIEKQHKPQATGRKLLREQFMGDGCLSHKSGLAFGDLCLFTRQLIRQTFLNQ